MCYTFQATVPLMKCTLLSVRLVTTVVIVIVVVNIVLVLPVIVGFVIADIAASRLTSGPIYVCMHTLLRF